MNSIFTLFYSVLHMYECSAVGQGFHIIFELVLLISRTILLSLHDNWDSLLSLLPQL